MKWFKKTDREKLEKVFNEVGIEFESSDEYCNIVVDGGYCGFYFIIDFDDNGKVKEYGSYE